MEPKYPDIHVQLTGRDGNAFNILGSMREAMRRAKDDDGKPVVPAADIEKFTNEATNSDYDHLLATCMKWCDVS